MRKKLREMLIPKGRTIYFDEELHKYSNDLGFVYTSTTTAIGKYCPQKDFKKIAKICAAIGRNPSHPKYQHYKGKTDFQLLKEWGQETDRACKDGTAEHDGLEQCVKSCTGYKLNAKGFINGKIYTIDDIMFNHNFGRLKLKDFERNGIKDKYPDIYNILVGLSNAGYYIYAEIGVYDDLYGISGLIDILCVNHTTNEFIILDWKTNKAPMRFDSGYYEKTVDGRLNLDKWKPNTETFNYPLNHLADSTGNHYTMQLSVYAYLVTTFGYTLNRLILCHIRPLEEQFTPRDQWQRVIELYPIQYLNKEVKLMLDDHKQKNTETQGKLQFDY